MRPRSQYIKANLHRKGVAYAFLLFFASPLTVAAGSGMCSVFASLTDSLRYTLEATANISASGDFTPFWLTSNRYGMAGVKDNSGHFSARLFRDAHTDSLHLWSWGFGIECVTARNYTSNFFLEQIYLESAYKKTVFSIGAKNRPAAFKDAELSTGSQTFGINARPIPEIRVDIPDYITISGKKRIVSLRGHFGYGYLFDDNWVQRHARSIEKQYVKHVLYHSKAGYLKVGNEKFFPLVAEGGLEMASTFGGMFCRPDGFNTSFYDGLIDFLDVVIGVGHDKGESDYKNSKGNTVGSWLFSLSWHGRGWMTRFYYDHFFEDHSGLFYKYGDYDGLYGLEFSLKGRHAIEKIVGEYIYTRYQSGAMYHDHTQFFPGNIGGMDDYYNHALYAGWQYWGMAIGNPLFLSPLYNRDRRMSFRSNRFSAQHIGVSGTPLRELHYRLLFTFSRQWGTYKDPYDEVRYQRSLLAEMTYSPQKLFGIRADGWQFAGAFALDRGSHTGNNSAFSLSIRKNGLLTSKKGKE